MRDSYGREIEYMRISVTDRCNFRCRYCMPEGIEKVPMARILTYEEIAGIAEAASELGISRFKITGGEPLVRKGVPSLISMLKGIDGVRQVTMTTNGSLLYRYISELAVAGLNGINVSLDTLKNQKFKELTGGGELEEVLISVDEAIAYGLDIKLNTVIQKGFNDDEVIDLVRFADDKGLDIRFIELMPIGFGALYKGITDEEIRQRLSSEFGRVRPYEGKIGNGPASYYSFEDLEIRVGFIGALSEEFCSSCNRIRLDSRGRLRSCLCFDEGVDLRSDIALGKDALKEAIAEAVMKKPKHHHFGKEGCTKDRMISIGG